MIRTRNGVRVTKTQLKGALGRYRRGEASLEQLEKRLGVFGHHGKFLRRAWAKDLGVTNVTQDLVKVEADA